MVFEMLGLFQPCDIKIRFLNKEDARQAFDVLFEKVGRVTRYEALVFGITSLEHLKLIDETGIPYERIA